MGLAVLGDDVALDPGPRDRRVVRYLVLVLARLYTQAAAHAFRRVDQEGPAHVGIFDRRPCLFVAQERKRAGRHYSCQRAAARLLQEVSS